MRKVISFSVLTLCASSRSSRSISDELLECLRDPLLDEAAVEAVLVTDEATAGTAVAVVADE